MLISYCQNAFGGFQTHFFRACGAKFPSKTGISLLQKLTGNRLLLQKFGQTTPPPPHHDSRQ